MLILKKGKTEESGNYRPVSLSSIPGKLLQPCIKHSLCKYREDGGVITSSHHGLTKNKSCQTSWISFPTWPCLLYPQAFPNSVWISVSDRAADVVDEGKVVDRIYLDVNKAFYTVPRDILRRQLENCGLSTATIRWIHN